jgi:hypothetical protein
MFRSLIKRMLEWKLLKAVFRGGKASGRSQRRRWRYP